MHSSTFIAWHISINYVWVLLILFAAVTISDIDELQQQIKHLMNLLHKLTMEFREVKKELELSRMDVDSIQKSLGVLLSTVTE